MHAVNHQCNIKKDSFIGRPVELTLSDKKHGLHVRLLCFRNRRAQNHRVYRWFQEVTVSSLGFLPDFHLNSANIC